MVWENDIRTCDIFLFIFPDDDLPPLETDTGDINSGREGSEESNFSYAEIRIEQGFGDIAGK